jgi:hypothetical protein
MLLLQVIRRVHACNIDNAFAVRATLQKLHACYLSRCRCRAVSSCFRPNAVLFLPYSNDATRDLMQRTYQKCRGDAHRRVSLSGEEQLDWRGAGKTGTNALRCAPLRKSYVLVTN